MDVHTPSPSPPRAQQQQQQHEQQQLPRTGGISADFSNPPTHGTRLQKRSSLPAPATTPDMRTKKPSPSHVFTHAASPEIISSLIDQLSAISIPAHNHFENLAIGYTTNTNTVISAGASTSTSARSPDLSPASPSLHTLSGRTSLAGSHGPAPDHAAYYDALREHDALYSDDACEPPVIRTSKPPSGRSPLTAPKKAEKSHSLGSYIRRSAGSCASLHSAYSARSTSSIGNISVEAGGVQPQPSCSSNRSSAESKRSFKGRSLMYMSSREQLKQKETDRKRASTQVVDVVASPASPRKTAQLFPYEDTINEEPPAREDHHHHHHQHNEQSMAESSQFNQWYSSTNNSPRRIRINLIDGLGGESPADKGLIPTRASSLRHSANLAKKSKKGHTRKRSTQEQHSPAPAPAPALAPAIEEDTKMNSELTLKEKILEELEQEESEVAKRIRELRQQKMLRDKLAGKLPESIDAGAPDRQPNVSNVTSLNCSPTSTTSSASEQHAQNFIKARKVLGITTGIPPTDACTELPPPERKETRDMGPVAPTQTLAWRHSRHRSLTVNDGDNTMSLPNDYTLALRNFAESEPSPSIIGPSRVASPVPISPQRSNISIASTTGTTSSHATIKRSNSFSEAGGRPSSGRKASPFTFLDATPRLKYSPSKSRGTASERTSPLRSTNADMPPRPHTLHVGSSATNSMQLQQRRALKKQRWSHPDLPAKAENKHNAKIDASEAAAAATHKLSRLVVEERPTSADSVDMDVNSYLNSSRLSQKIRHPQTGRIISFSEVGDPEGYAIFVCVGMGLTRYVMAFYDQLALTLKLRLITPDRPGIGGSQADPNGTPLSWPDDVLVICQALKITKFSLLAHSAGAVYALATSLRMPQHIRGRVHLLAPWIPPSQMAPIGISQNSPPTQQLPRSQRFLRTLPPSLLKIANSTFLSSTSASLQRTGPKNAPRTRRRILSPQLAQAQLPVPRPALKDSQRDSMLLMDQVLPNATSLNLSASSPTCANFEETISAREALSLAEKERQHAFDERLTFAIWDRATANANPATDLIVCLETKQPIGFRYEDINRPVVIHHGSKDSRVPADNVRWLGKLMRKCEVRILEGEQHGLMASAGVMGDVLTEMASDWENWTAITGQSSVGDLRAVSRRKTAEKLWNP